MLASLGSSFRVELVVIDDDEVSRSLVVRQLKDLYAGTGIRIVECASVSETLNHLNTVDHSRTAVPLLISDFTLKDGTGLELIQKVRSVRDKIAETNETPSALALRTYLPLTNFLLLSDQISLEDISGGLRQNLIDSYLTKPCQTGLLEKEVKKLVSAYFLDHRPELLELQPHLVTHFALHEALQKALDEKQKLGKQLHSIQESAIQGAQTMSDSSSAILAPLVAEVLAWLKENNKADQIKSFKNGSVILREHEVNTCVRFVISGEVIQKKLGRHGDVELMTQGVGELIGLRSMFSNETSFSTVTAKADTELALMSRNDIAELIADSSEFLTLFLRGIFFILHRRVTMVSETKVELQDMFQELKETQLKLIESEKMATLGILTAGVAHELNNPAAALDRAAEHIRTNLESALAKSIGASSDPRGASSDPRGASLDLGFEVFRKTATAEPASTSELRKKTRELEPRFEPHVARKMAEMQLSGAFSQVGNSSYLNALSAADVEYLHHFYATGNFLNNIKSCSERISALVKGMKNYAHAESADFIFFDLRNGIEDTLVVLQNRLKLYDLETSYQGHACVFGVPSKLNQVWTNLLNNACDATPPGGKIRVNVFSMPDASNDVNAKTRGSLICVRITDSGSGITPENSMHIFEPRFTTKNGRDGIQNEQIGLGLGLAIVKKIVTEHGGEIVFDSFRLRKDHEQKDPSTSSTFFEVRLPAKVNEEH